jgi:hypothetical protein
MNSQRYKLKNIPISEIHSGDIIYREFGNDIEIFECVTHEKPKTYRFLATVRFLATSFYHDYSDSIWALSSINSKQLNNSCILDRKDPILYSYLKTKSLRYFELLKD